MRRRPSSGCSSRSSSASAWCRRKSSVAASTRCCRSRSAAPQLILGKYLRARADACRQRRRHDGRAVRGARVHDLHRVRGDPIGLGRARARSGAPQSAFFLIFVELMLITALALFFSTFSTPLLSAALTFGLYLVGHFNADLRNFEQVVDSKPAAWLARGALSRAAGSVGVRRQDRRSCTGSRWRPATSR